jgi:hypothetical protein
MQRATESLEQEHRTIEKILRVIGVLADELAENRYILSIAYLERGVASLSAREEGAVGRG